MEHGVMESIREATERAATILEENNYTALSTADEKGPWAAVVAYAAAAPNFLYFVSQRDSRHAKAVAQAPAVSGVIYNSSTEPDDADSIQFSGTCAEIGDERLLRLFLERTAHLSAASVDVELAAFREYKGLGLYGIAVREAYVLDRELWLEL